MVKFALEYVALTTLGPEGTTTGAPRASRLDCPPLAPTRKKNCCEFNWLWPSTDQLNMPTGAWRSTETAELALTRLTMLVLARREVCATIKERTATATA